MRIATGTFHLALAFLGGLVLLFLLAPLLSMVLHTSSPQFSAALTDPEVTGSIWLTLSTSLVATLVMSICAIPLAYVLARREFRGKSLVLGIINLPIVIPHSSAGLALLGVLARGGFLGQLGECFGLSFVGTPVAIALAMAFVSVPFLITAAMEGFAAVPARLEKAALNLGASPARTFFTISLPLARRAILAGLVLMWSRGLSEFGAVLIVAYHPMVTPVLVFDRFSSFGLEQARATAVLFIFVSLGLLIAFKGSALIVERRRRAAFEERR